MISKKNLQKLANIFQAKRGNKTLALDLTNLDPIHSDEHSDEHLDEHLDTSFIDLVIDDDVTSFGLNNQICNPKIIQIMNTIAGISIQTIQPPRMVVVGTQSSGKSSILNGIMGIEILPTGKNMVTRCPLVLELDRGDTDTAIFGRYQDNGTFQEISRHNLQDPKTFDQIHNEIERITVENAGEEMNITPIPIYLRITGPNVPTMTLVDLPGLTMVAREDDGQPADIKQQIRKLVVDFISEPNTIIMCCMAARSDLETDMALDLVKEIDQEGKRTIGILTKVDLMNRDSNVTDYLTNRCSKNLKLKYQYYAVRNKTSQERTLQEARHAEKEFFYNHPLYGNLKNKVGTDVVSRELSNILMKRIQEALPEIKMKINKEKNALEKELKDIGTHIPIDNVNETLGVLDTVLLSRLACRFNLELNAAGTQGIYGSRLRQIFCDYRKRIRSNYVVPTIEELKHIICNSQGNHMDFAVSPITIVEHCMLNGAFRTMAKDSEDLVSQVIDLLTDLASVIISKEKISLRFPAFIDEINILMNEYVWDRRKTLGVIEDLIDVESSYLWTENENFRKTLTNTPTEPDELVEHIQNLCRTYMDTVHDTFGNIVPKICMKYLVCESQKLDQICKQHLQHYSLDRIQFLLSEDGALVDKRNELIGRFDKLKTARNILANY